MFSLSDKNHSDVVEALKDINAANFHANHSHVRKQIKLSGSCLSTIYRFGSTQLSDHLMSYRCSDTFLTK